jgi:hypothetical protein
MHLLVTKISAQKGVNLMPGAVAKRNHARDLCF